jgi:hypothetical protein
MSLKMSKAKKLGLFVFELGLQKKFIFEGAKKGFFFSSL